MLGRTASGLFWLFRYLERMENTARLINAAQWMSLTRMNASDSDWLSVLNTVGAADVFDPEARTLDPEHRVMPGDVIRGQHQTITRSPPDKKRLADWSGDGMNYHSVLHDMQNSRCGLAVHP